MKLSREIQIMSLELAIEEVTDELDSEKMTRDKETELRIDLAIMRSKLFQLTFMPADDWMLGARAVEYIQ